jgi:plasmid stability protein
MSNLTISMDEKLIKKARVRAIQQGTSLSAKVREFLTDYAMDTHRPNPQIVAGQAFLEAARSSKVSPGASWSREDAYDRSYPRK